MNKMIGRKQMTFFCNVENRKVSHVDPKEVTNFMEWLEGVYGELIIARGKLHKFFGMTLNFRTP